MPTVARQATDAEITSPGQSSTPVPGASTGVKYTPRYSIDSNFSFLTRTWVDTAKEAGEPVVISFKSQTGNEDPVTGWSDVGFDNVTPSSLQSAVLPLLPFFTASWDAQINDPTIASTVTRSDDRDSSLEVTISARSASVFTIHPDESW